MRREREKCFNFSILQISENNTCTTHRHSKYINVSLEHCQGTGSSLTHIFMCNQDQDQAQNPQSVLNELENKAFQ